MPMTSLPTPSRPIKIAIVGDVHNAWDADDGPALKQLAVDLVLFVGDFGNEAVDVVDAIAALSIPKAVILGNHDAWYTATPWGAKKCPYDRREEDRVQQQLDRLGIAHVGFSHLDFPALNLSVVGARPFSWGDLTGKIQRFIKRAMVSVALRNPPLRWLQPRSRQPASP